MKAAAPHRIAALPMYDLQPAAVQAWWQGVAAALREEGIAGVPDTLQWPADLDAHWRDPALLLSQTCGHPLVTRLQGAVQVVGAMRYGAPGCEGIDYRSVLLAREGDAATLAQFAGRTAAVNDLGSYSGCIALRKAVAAAGGDAGFFSRVQVTGSHRASIAALRAGTADIAAIDAVTHALIARHQPELLNGLRGIGFTAAAPGLPLITALGTSAADVQALQRALQAACRAPALAELRRALLIEGFEPAPASRWLQA